MVDERFTRLTGAILLGETVHHYRIIGRLGAGGMGEVYRAEDTRLRRKVAIKVLPEALAADPERLRRLKSEARAMAAVDHPNVATIYAVEQHEEQVLLILELVEGETLAERVKRGRLPVGEALEVGRQVAGGLAAAHAEGVVHRDLKPANVMLGPKGQVKLLDFGLAKALAPPPAGEDLASSPTLTMEGATEPGAILGTAAYLSPEQARGQAVDERTDVWAFGCLLFELLSGRRVFSGASFTDTVAAVVNREPDWEALPATTPATVRWLLRRCLDKDADERLHSIADARLLLEGLEEIVDGGAVGTQPSPARSLLPWLVALLLATVAGVGAGWLLLPRNGSEVGAKARVVRFSLFADPADATSSFAPSWQLSPDDRFFAYQTVPGAGARPSSILLRSIEDGTVRELARTEGARSMTFSPDGRQIAFFDEKSLKRVSLRDGTVETIVTFDYELWVGLAWADEGFLAIASWIPRGLWRVDPSGGKLEGLSVRDTDVLQSGTNDFLFYPNDIPGRRFLLFTLRRLPSEDHVEILSLEDGERRTLSQTGSRAAFVPPHFVAYYHQGKLFALPFDPRAGRAEGGPVAVLDGVRDGMFSISRSGSLVYAPSGEGDESGGGLVVARRGREPTPLPVGIRVGGSPRVSPDGTRIVFSSEEGSERANLWLFDLERQTARRLTGEEGNEWWSAWGPDGRLAFQSDREDHAFLDLYVMDPDRPGSTRKVLDGGDCYLQPQEWTPDGLLLYQRSCVASGTLDIFTLDVDSGETRPLRETEAREKHPSVSPDGQWLAFASNLSGEDQVYLTTYPEPGRLLQVSPAGGDGPIWTPTGDGLYFHSGAELFFVPFDGEAASPLGTPEVAVRGVPANSYVARSYDLFPDGRILLQSSAPVREVRIVLDWHREVAATLGMDR